MTAPAITTARPRTIADISTPYPAAVLAVIGFVVGIVWFPAWFLTAQMLRLWSGRGCMTWLKSRGVPEYTDEKYAQIIGYGPLALIVARVLLALNWLEPWQVVADHKLDTTQTGESATFLAVVFGIALATALTGVMKTHGLPWLIGAAGFVLVAFLVAGGYGAIWKATAISGLGVIVVAYLIAKIPLTINQRMDKRAAKRAEEALTEANPGGKKVFK
jgi:hypothetical protein